MTIKTLLRFLALALCCVPPAFADINVGITVSATGPAATLGIPERNAVALFADKIEGQHVNYIVLDDATDPALATRNARKLVEEKKIDLLIGSSSVPGSMSVAAVAQETKTPLIALAPVELPPERSTWIFRTPQHNRLMAQALIDHATRSGVKRLGFIGFADGFGDSWLKEMKALCGQAGINLDPVERYNRTDTSVTGQVVKLVAANPDAVLIVGSGTPAALPARALADRGYKGKLYQTHGAANRDFIRIGGSAVEGTVLPVGPLVVANQLPGNHPSKKMATAFIERYEKQFGAGSANSFAGHMFDAYVIFYAAATQALQSAKPGTPAFRQALRDALENLKDVVGVHGVFSTSAQDHWGHDQRARVLVRIENGDWKLIGN